MKRILFFIPTLGGGGAEKVLVNLVNNIDKSKYDVTVQTLFDVGINKKFLNNDVKYRTCFKKIFKGNIHILKIFSKKFLFKKMIQEDYDIIVSYLEGPTTRIVSGCQNKKTKLINWVHTEQTKGLVKSYRSYKEMKETYERYDSTIYVAETVRDSFEKSTNIRPKNASIVMNIIDDGVILELAKEQVDSPKERNNICYSCKIN